MALLTNPDLEQVAKLLHIIQLLANRRQRTMSNKLHSNLVSGDSYLTQHSDNPAEDGQIIYDNIMATAKILFGDNEDDIDFIIDNLDEVGEYWSEEYSPQTGAEAIDAIAKRRGGRGWL